MTKLLFELGAEYQDEVMVNLTCRRLQLDEIWSFVYAKAKNVPEDMEGTFGVGDVWTWTAIDAETKLVPCWLVPGRDGEAAKVFVANLAKRMAHRVQVTSDGLKAYLEAVEEGFGADVDFTQLVKVYGTADGSDANDKKYSPAPCVGCKKTHVVGLPDANHISTSFVGRQNLSMWMMMRRFTWLTNAFSKKVLNHGAAISLYFMYYNFARFHMTVRSTLARKAGVTDHLWTVEEIVGLFDNRGTFSN